jgi:ABC-type lipoprotein release transport system permease subunit
MKYAFKILISQPLRLTLTVIGISLCIVLILFLLGIYHGVAEGSVEYIRKNKADIWILQSNTTNILRGTSILSSFYGDLIQEDENVDVVSPVLLILTTVKSEGKSLTIFLAGYHPALELGGPPSIVEGRNIRSDQEIVLDKSFAAKINVKVGNKIEILNDTLQVVGISSGTNAFVIQYGFVSINRAQSLINFPDLVTCFLVKLKSNANVKRVSDELEKKIDGITAYDQQTFLLNNIKEMESGVLPLLYAVAGIGAVVLTAILSMILSINILERRKDFAIMKILGSPEKFLPLIVMYLAISITFISCIVGTIIYFPLCAIIEKISPEVSTKIELLHIVLVSFVAVLMGLISSFISIQRIRKIYPLEVFQ